MHSRFLILISNSKKEVANYYFPRRKSIFTSFHTAHLQLGVRRSDRVATQYFLLDLILLLSSPLSEFFHCSLFRKYTVASYHFVWAIWAAFISLPIWANFPLINTRRRLHPATEILSERRHREGKWQIFGPSAASFQFGMGRFYPKDSFWTSSIICFPESPKSSEIPSMDSFACTLFPSRLNTCINGSNAAFNPRGNWPSATI